MILKEFRANWIKRFGAEGDPVMGFFEAGAATIRVAAGDQGSVRWALETPRLLSDSGVKIKMLSKLEKQCRFGPEEDSSIVAGSGVLNPLRIKGGSFVMAGFGTLVPLGFASSWGRKAG